MAHYDLYQDLSLERSKSAAELANELQVRIQQLAPGANAERDKLQTAQKILGDAQRRSVYDAQLDDASAPTIDIARLREIAAMQTQSQASQQGWSEQAHPLNRTYNLQVNASKFPVSAQRKKEDSLMWTIGWGVILLGWIIVGFNILVVRFSSGAESLEAAFDTAYSAGRLVMSIFMAAINHAAMYTLLSVLWGVRRYMGRNMP
ncbi:hypothetical protein [Corynebacterium pseudopelargi]|uniref:J domain-containing protein n=1 Tax=Corynebacterium pseudopelargi TaxID=2080757 RepID=A0A3G6IW15_9CORY|nr:hypothetical protein [Corynebacterium pseudopelargi]AZA09882.1 hypothetical protein CPPEL_08895 [Corynebacterium pseudopelargi]